MSAQMVHWWTRNIKKFLKTELNRILLWSLPECVLWDISTSRIVSWDLIYDLKEKMGCQLSIRDLLYVFERFYHLYSALQLFSLKETVKSLSTRILFKMLSDHVWIKYLCFFTMVTFLYLEQWRNQQNLKL